MITCFLCNRQWPKEKARHVERDHWACGEPRHCHQYTNSAAATKLLHQRRGPLYRTDPAAYRVESSWRSVPTP